MPYHDGYFIGPWWWIMIALMALFWIVVLGAIIWLIAYVAKRSGSSGSGQTGTETALDILNQRYARGEIEREEYDRMKREITGGQV